MMIFCKKIYHFTYLKVVTRGSYEARKKKKERKNRKGKERKRKERKGRKNKKGKKDKEKVKGDFSAEKDLGKHEL